MLIIKGLRDVSYKGKPWLGEFIRQDKVSNL